MGASATGAATEVVATVGEAEVSAWAAGVVMLVGATGEPAAASVVVGVSAPATEPLISTGTVFSELASPTEISADGAVPAAGDSTAAATAVSEGRGAVVDPAAPGP